MSLPSERISGWNLARRGVGCCRRCCQMPREERSSRAFGLLLTGGRGKIELSTFCFSEGLSSTWQPLSDTAPQPALPAEGPVRSLRQQFSRYANVCRVMPFRPCYLRVRPPPGPGLVLDLCCRSSPG